MWQDSGYAYAKASWIIGKSFLGKRISLLAGIHTLSELDRLIFPDRHRELPGRELLVDMERRINQRAVRQILSVVNSYSHPPKLLVRMIKGFEYSDLKECLMFIAAGKEDKPEIYDIGRFKSISFNNYPDITSMLKKTEFDFLLSEELKSIEAGTELANPAWASIDISAIESKLDYRFYNGLIESLAQLSDEDREAAFRLIADEISLRNCVWALRLRTYFQKTEIETAKYLMDLKLPGGINRISNFYQKKASLAAEAKVSLDFPLDMRLPWRGWRWDRFLNSENSISAKYSPAQAMVTWSVDPRHFQNAASQYLYQLAFHNFHSAPVSVGAIYCFIKLKLFEEDLLTSVAEGLSLGMDSSAIFRLLEIS